MLIAILGAIEYLDVNKRYTDHSYVYQVLLTENELQFLLNQLLYIYQELDLAHYY